MPHVLKNKNLEIHFDLPNENYNFSRFDWTGKIVEVKFQGLSLSSLECTDGENENHFGKGFYNEFGIDAALGFDEAEIGGWFHKIGVGLLKKDSPKYLFSKPYEIQAAQFKSIVEFDRISITCKSDTVNGYSYILEKTIELQESSFTIKYQLQNTGKKDITTTEYVHNFTAINKALISKDYLLKFPFRIKPERFGETVNPEQKVDIQPKEIMFNGTPKEPFFFSNLTGSEMVDAAWELSNRKHNIGISETGSFQTNKVNLWGWTHVISPELFFDIFIKPGQSRSWARRYELFRLK